MSLSETAIAPEVHYTPEEEAREQHLISAMERPFPQEAGGGNLRKHFTPAGMHRELQNLLPKKVLIGVQSKMYSPLRSCWGFGWDVDLHNALWTSGWVRSGGGRVEWMTPSDPEPVSPLSLLTAHVGGEIKPLKAVVERLHYFTKGGRNVVGPRLPAAEIALLDYEPCRVSPDLEVKMLSVAELRKVLSLPTEPGERE